MNTPDTRERLLDAAEHLFAHHGIGSTSLRSITAEAETNLASVHYHFGSKEALIEAVFARPGLGKLVIGAIQGRDTALVMGIVVVGATAYVLINFLMDLIYAWLDPRITYS